MTIWIKSFGLAMNSLRRPLSSRMSMIVLRVSDVASCSCVMMSGRS
ncbi:hypothetical protein [Ornithinimicrobium kibberense]